MGCFISASVIFVLCAAVPAQKAVLVLVPRTNHVERIRTETQPEIKHAYVYSQSNDNEQFSVVIEIEPSDSWGRSAEPQLLVNDHEIGGPWGITAPGGEKITSVHCHVGKTDAEKIANALGVKCATRQKPAYELKVKFTPEKKSYSLNEKIEILEGRIGVPFGITNVGEEPFEVTLWAPRGRPTNFSFTVTHAGIKQKYIGAEFNFGAIGISDTLTQGKTISRSYDMSDWYAFDKPGRYTVDAKCIVTVRRPRKEVGWPKNCQWAHEEWDYEFKDTFTIDVVR